MEERRYCSIQEQIISNLCFVPRGKKQLKLKFTRQTYTHTQRACYITMIILMTIFDLFWRDDMHHRYVYPVCLPRAIDVSLLTSDVAQYLPVIDQRDPNVSFTHRVVRCLEEDSSNIHHSSHQLVSRDGSSSRYRSSNNKYSPNCRRFVERNRSLELTGGC